MPPPTVLHLRARSRSYLLATGSNGAGQLGIGHVEDVGEFQRCRFDVRPTAASDGARVGRTGSVDRNEKDGTVGKFAAEELEEDDPLADPEAEILALTSGASHALLLIRVSSSTTSSSCRLASSPSCTLTKSDPVNRVYICGTSSRGQLGPEVRPGPLGVRPVTRWRRLNVEELLASAGLHHDGGSGGRSAFFGRTESSQKAPGSIEARRIERSTIYKIKSIACTWTTSFILLSRTLSTLESGNSPEDGEVEDERMDDVLLSFGSNDSGELGVEIDSEATSGSHVHVVQFPTLGSPLPTSSSSSPNDVSDSANLSESSAAHAKSRANATRTTGQARSDGRVRMEIDLLRASQRNTLCVCRYILCTDATSMTPFCTSQEEDDVARRRSATRTRGRDEIILDEVLYGWGASRQGQLNGETVRALRNGIHGEGDDDSRQTERGGLHAGLRDTRGDQVAAIGERLPGRAAGSNRKPLDGNQAKSTLCHHNSVRTTSTLASPRIIKPTTAGTRPTPNPIRTLRFRPTPFPSITPTPTRIHLPSSSSSSLPLSRSTAGKHASDAERDISHEAGRGRDVVRVKDLAVGASHVMILLQDGRILSLGSDKKGQLPLSLPYPLEPIGLSAFGPNEDEGSRVEWDRVGACWNTSFAIGRAENEVGMDMWACGSGGRGQLGSRVDDEPEEGEGSMGESRGGVLRKVELPLGSSEAGSTNARDERASFSSAAFGSEHVLTILTERPTSTTLTDPPHHGVRTHLFAWGWNEHGNLGLGQGDLDDRRVPVRVDLEGGSWRVQGKGMRNALEVGGREGVVAEGGDGGLLARDVSVECVWAGCGTSWVLVREC